MKSSLTSCSEMLKSATKTTRKKSVPIIKPKLQPEFGLRYEHMFGFGGVPMQYTLMGMVKLPIAHWSAKENKANIESLEWKASSLRLEKEAMMNEVLGMAYAAKAEIELRSK